ncbi:uncharacterized SAM-binding protein YcdF (DUF218 family) [Enterobacter sp. BIGb0383]|uniref:YdcF family protein n=1 Tax=unclassified Enterobacter TaxID=2608935 RepID=UPI000F49703F|nr:MULTISPECIES: YdcF family protein [unclassified Enterobacter]ROP62261.1 uncharacterized SAM-binding protein YcdF (DUF218 family) [Enterobacter sp. BIGb0383]ROS12422.1 uncharacterized SAM-binding protein YcdF (DUF218 family) [Enterobacter sp. BIGb0359]
MFATDLIQLNDNTRLAANLLGRWLAQQETTVPPVLTDNDVIVLAGNAAIPTIDAACQLAASSGALLVISGGIGHSTTFLYAAVARHSRYHTLPTTGLAEATILADIAHHFWQIPRERILCETASGNCGENARFTRTLLEAQGITRPRGVLVQDPTMQRRTLATFARVWRDIGGAENWRSWPGFVPVLEQGENGAVFAGDLEGLWAVERYLSLIIGELPRLRDDASGYGPQGRDFIEHITIPPEVEAAWRTLCEDQSLRALPGLRALA